MKKKAEFNNLGYTLDIYCSKCHTFFGTYAKMGKETRMFVECSFVQDKDGTLRCPQCKKEIGQKLVDNNFGYRLKKIYPRPIA